MLCEHCNSKEATSIFNLVKQNKIKYLCGKCYKQLSSDIALDVFASNEADNLKVDIKCLNCGLTLEQVKKNKIFKCENCYEFFSELIKEEYFKIFKANTHKGKQANSYLIKKQIKELEQMVEICIKNNDYDRAGRYSSQINKIKEEYYGKY